MDGATLKGIKAEAIGGADSAEFGPDDPDYYDTIMSALSLLTSNKIFAAGSVSRRVDCAAKWNFTSAAFGGVNATVPVLLQYDTNLAMPATRVVG